MGISKGKASKVLSQSFVENNENVSEDQAADAIIKAQLTIKQLEEERDADEKLNAAKGIVKDLNAGYSSAIRYEKAKINFLLEKIQEIQNGEVNPTSGANS
jgi:hypothetical protein